MMETVLDYASNPLITLTTAVLCGYIAYGKWQTRNQRIIEDAFAAQQGCEPMKACTRGWLPWNIDLVVGLMRANMAGRLLAYQQLFIDKLGNNLEQRILGDIGLVTLDPENVEAILSKSKFRKSELDYVFGKRRDAFLPQLGEGLFTQDGAAWKHSREMLRKQFSRIQYHDMGIFADHVELLIGRLTATIGSTVDLLPLFADFTLDTTTALLFGQSAGSLREGANDEFGESFDEASWISGVRVKLVHFYWVYNPPRYRSACRKVKQYADTMVKEALSRNGHKEADSEERFVFIRSLYNELRDRTLVRDQLINVLLAGRDTTACCLSWVFYLLARHGTVWDKLSKEVKDVLGHDTAVDRSHIQKMDYLRCVLAETLRLYPSVPLNVRGAKYPTVIPKGGGENGTSPVLVRVDQGVGYSPYHMHRRKDLYGSDALQFVPERWEDGSLKEKVGWGYLPFNGGPRVCLGQEFALMEASYVIVRIVQAFSSIAVAPGEEMVPTGEERQLLTLTLAPADGCKVVLGN